MVEVAVPVVFEPCGWNGLRTALGVEGSNRGSDEDDEVDEDGLGDEVDGDDGVLERARILLDSPSLLGASKISKIWKCGMGSSASTSHCRVEAALRFLRGLRPVAFRAAESSLEVDEVLWRRLTDEAIANRRKPRQGWFWVRIAHSLLARAYLYFQERSCHLDTS